MMRIILLTILLSFFYLLLSAQEKDSLQLSNTDKVMEAGLDITAFVNRFLSLNDQNGGTGKYLLALKIHRKEKRTLRLGFDFFTEHKLDQNDPNDNEDFNRITDRLITEFRIGSEKQRTIKGKWQVNTGFDVFSDFYWDRVKTDRTNEFIKTDEKTIRLGFGPVVGFQFNLNEKMGLYTETSLYLTNSWNKVSTTFQEESQNNTGDTNFSSSMGISTPNSITFFLKF